MVESNGVVYWLRRVFQFCSFSKVAIWESAAPQFVHAVSGYTQPNYQEISEDHDIEVWDEMKDVFLKSE